MIQDRFKDASWFKPLDIIQGGAGGIGSPLLILLARLNHSIILYEKLSLCTTRDIQKQLEKSIFNYCND